MTSLGSLPATAWVALAVAKRRGTAPTLVPVRAVALIAVLPFAAITTGSWYVAIVISVAALVPVATILSLCLLRKGQNGSTYGKSRD
jgi:fatty acid desaturase